MSRQFATRRFHCSNDCRQSGCPGHEAKLTYEHASDTRTLDVDGEVRARFDASEWRVFVNLDAELRERRRLQTPSLSEAARAEGLSPLLIESGRPSRANADLIRRHAEGLAREIQSDVMAPESEIADAIEAAIRRFARQDGPDSMRREPNGDWLFTDWNEDVWRLRPTRDDDLPLIISPHSRKS